MMALIGIDPRLNLFPWIFNPSCKKEVHVNLVLFSNSGTLGHFSPSFKNPRSPQNLDFGDIKDFLY